MSMQKEYKKTKKINYKTYIIIDHLCLVNLFDKYYKEAYSYFKIRDVPQNVSAREITQLEYILKSQKY